jgi:hypothetical protein
MQFLTFSEKKKIGSAREKYSGGDIEPSKKNIGCEAFLNC